MLTTNLMGRVAPLSVLTRGADSAYRRARQAAQFAELELFTRRAAAAESSGDRDEQLAALQAENAKLKEDVTEATELGVQAEERASDLARTVARPTAQVEQLTLAGQYSPTGPNADPTLANAPTGLVVADVGSLDALCQHLERATDGRITFTSNAIVSWRKADQYPTPEDMRIALLKLAAVADDLNDGQERKMGHLDTWIRENYDLKVSLQDDQLPKKVRQFTWEDQQYDRTAHVQVNDGVPPWACGRIYSYLDSDQRRLLVDHIGLHL